MPHATVAPARLKVHSTDLACDVLRTFGYQARCACGAQFPIRTSHALARQDAREHIREHRDDLSATRGTEAS